MKKLIGTVLEAVAAYAVGSVVYDGITNAIKKHDDKIREEARKDFAEHIPDDLIDAAMGLAREKENSKNKAIFEAILFRNPEVATAYLEELSKLSEELKAKEES